MSAVALDRASVPPHLRAMLPDASSLPTIPTERLLLREITPEDVPALFGVFGDPVVCRYRLRPALPDLAAAAAFQADVARRFQEREMFQWGIAGRADGTLVGTCTLHALSDEHRRAELGYTLARAAWGRGYVAEALPALIRFAFETLKLHRLEANVDPRNERSIRVLEREGFEREGHLRERYHVQGEVQDALLFGLLRREWSERGAEARRR